MEMHSVLEPQFQKEKKHWALVFIKGERDSLKTDKN